MSQENVQIGRRGYELFAAGDLVGVAGLFSPDAEVADTGVLGVAGTAGADAPLGGFGAGTELLLRPAPTGQELRWKQATSYCDFSL